MNTQPIWKLVAQLGDVHPIEHGGYFVFEDTTGVYALEGEILIQPEDWILDRYESDPDNAREPKWEIRRFILEPCTFINGILSDNKFHPDKPAWFAKPESERAERPQDTTYLKNVCDYAGIENIAEFARMFCEGTIEERALAWQAIGNYHGWDNLDGDPLYLIRAEVVARYAEHPKLAPRGWQSV